MKSTSPFAIFEALAPLVAAMSEAEVVAMGDARDDMQAELEEVRDAAE